MKRILLFFGLLLLANILIGQTTQKDTVNVKPFEDLTLVTDGTVDTSDQLLIYDISSGTFAFRGSLGELLKKIADVQNIISTSNIVNATIVNEDISGSAAIALSKLETLSANRLVGRDTTGTGIPESLAVGYGLTMGTDRIDTDTVSEDGLVSKSRLANALDDVGSGGGNASGRALQTITADGADTLDFGGTSYAVDYWQIDMGSVSSSTLNFTNPNTSIVPTYNLHFLSADTDTVTFATTLLDANQDTITSHVFSQGQIVPMYYDNTGGVYYTNYLTLSTSSGGGSSGSTALSLGHTDNLIMAFVADSLVTEDGAGGVSQWGDFSGNNRHLIQSDSTSRPTTDVLGNMVLAGDDYFVIDTSWWGSVEDSAMTVMLVFEVSNTKTSVLHYFSEDALTGYYSYLTVDSIDATTYHNDYYVRDSDGAADTAIDDFYTGTKDSTYLFVALDSEVGSTEVRINGTQYSTKNNSSPWDGDQQNHRKGLGANRYRSNVGAPLIGKLKFFAIWNKKMTTSEVEAEEAKIKAYLSDLDF